MVGKHVSLGTLYKTAICECCKIKTAKKGYGIGGGVVILIGEYNRLQGKNLRESSITILGNKLVSVRPVLVVNTSAPLFASSTTQTSELLEIVHSDV